MRQTLNWIYRASGYLAAFFVFAIFAVMIGSTVMRELGLRTGGTDDIVAWFCAQLTSDMKKIGDVLLQDWLKKAGPDGQAVVDAYRKM